MTDKPEPFKVFEDESFETPAGRLQAEIEIQEALNPTEPDAEELAYDNGWFDGLRQIRETFEKLTRSAKEFRRGDILGVIDELLG